MHLLPKAPKTYNGENIFSSMKDSAGKWIYILQKDETRPLPLIICKYLLR
jgi:hypothetical protein